VLGTAGAAGLYRRSVKRWYWVLVYVLIELLVRCTTYILKLARGGLLLELLGASVAARYWIAAFD
jgi:hypothetical protein